jgi:site-specific DNA recombinase
MTAHTQAQGTASTVGRSPAALPASPTKTKKTPRRRVRMMADDQTADLGPVLVGVYIRVSLAREEMISPELQQRDVDSYLARMSQQTGRQWRTVVIQQDLDISGRSFARAGIQRLMELMREGAITTILTYRYDRFGRNLQQALAHLEEVETLGGQVVSVTEPIDASTAMGNYMRSQSLALADLQSRQIGEGWKRVHQYRVDRGLPTNGRERFGYLAHRSTHTRSDGALRLCLQGCAAGECQTGFVPDPETAPIVQRIYEEYLAGRGFQKIAKGLNEDDLVSPGKWGALRSGNPVRIARTATTTWTAGSVIDVADAGFAAGLITHNGRWFPGAQEPLISQAVWEAYQRRREAQRIVPTKARSPKWSLAGLAVCGQCGGKMYCTSSPRGEQYALYCSAQRTSGMCTGTYRTREPVEAAVALWLQRCAIELEEATKVGLAQAPKRPAWDPLARERRRLGKLLDNAQGKIDRLLDAYTDGALELAEYKRRRAEVTEDVEAAQRRLAGLDAAPARVPAAPVVREFADLWPTLSVEARRDVAGALLAGVRVHQDKTVEILPRWWEPMKVTFTKRNTVPQLPIESDADFASPVGDQRDQASAAL